MTRWLSGIFILTLAILPATGHAQVPQPQSGFQNTGYIGASPQSHPGSWGQSPYVPPAGGAAHAQLLPNDGGWILGPETRLGSLISNNANRSWVRFDFLHWDIKGADGTLVGAPVAPQSDGTPYDLTGVDRSNRLNATDRINGARPQTFVVVPRMGQAEENGLNGFRGTIGVPTTIGDFEASAFVLEEFNQTVRVTPFLDTYNFGNNLLIGAVTLLDDGQVVDNVMILFNEGMTTSLSTNFYGLEANWVNNPITPNVGLTIKPIAGVRYLNFKEQLSITGSDRPLPVNDPTLVLNHRINSLSQNHILGPQVGFRAESHRKRMTLGTDFKFLFGFNQISNQVDTAQIFNVDELPQVDTDDKTRFAPIVDFSVYGKYHATENLSFLISYQLIAGSGFSRAYDTINYDAPSAVNDPPTIGTRNQLSTFYAHGLTLGVEIIFP